MRLPMLTRFGIRHVPALWCQAKLIQCIHQLQYLLDDNSPFLLLAYIPVPLACIVNSLTQTSFTWGLRFHNLNPVVRQGRYTTVGYIFQALLEHHA